MERRYGSIVHCAPAAGHVPALRHDPGFHLDLGVRRDPFLQCGVLQFLPVVQKDVPQNVVHASLPVESFLSSPLVKGSV